MTTCIHRGIELRKETCQVCGPDKGKEIPIFSCPKHGECSHRAFAVDQRKREVPVLICIVCDDRTDDHGNKIPPMKVRRRKRKNKPRVIAKDACIHLGETIRFVKGKGSGTSPIFQCGKFDSECAIAKTPGVERNCRKCPARELRGKPLEVTFPAPEPTERELRHERIMAAALKVSFLPVRRSR